MKQLNSIDAAFLYLESAKAPMHVGGVYIFEKPEGKDQFNYKEFRDFIGSRIHQVDMFRQRLVEVPLNLGRPYWAKDPDFNLDFHLAHMAVPQPGGLKELMALAGRIFSRPLDRGRPLWEMAFVEGLNGIDNLKPGSFAVIAKAHHAAIDGMSGATMMAAIFDMFPKPVKVKPEEKPFKGEKIPHGLKLITKSTGKALNTPLKVLKFAKNTAVSTTSTVIEAAKKKVKAPPRLFSSPKTLFNVPVTHNRIFSGSWVELDRIKAIKNKVEGTTINDVVLTICSGALSKYLKGKKNPPKKSLVAMAPISVRSESKKNAGGNQISGMLVSLATDEKDLLSRLHAINTSSKGSKVYSKAVGAEQMMDLVPSQLASLASRLYTTMGVSEMHNPLYNLIITNVPGPPIPLYLNGAKMRAIFGLSPLFDGMALIITVFSYSGRVYFGLASCQEIMPDIDDLSEYIKDALTELEAAVNKKKTKKQKA